MATEFAYDDLPLGGDWYIPWVWVSPPVNVTGMEFEFTMWKPNGDIAVSKTSLGGGIVFTTPLTGEGGLLTILRADTVALAHGVYTAEARRTDAGHNTLLARGTFVL